MRLTKQQRQYQTETLALFKLDGEFKPGVRLVTELAAALVESRDVAFERIATFGIDDRRLQWFQRLAWWMLKRSGARERVLILAPWEVIKTEPTPASATTLPDGTPIPF